MAAQPADRPDGILPYQELAALVGEGGIRAERAFGADQVQPASLDLRLGTKAYRIRASFLPGPRRRAMDRLQDFVMHEIDLRYGAVLETGCVYLVPLMERLALPGDLSGLANPKSSTGRIDVFTRLITDYGTTFDTVAPGYEGPLFAEICPQTFSVLVRTGSSLNQLRLRRGWPRVSDADLAKLHAEHRIVDAEGDINEGLALTVDLVGDKGTALLGYRAKRHAGVIDVDQVDAYDPEDFWDPIPAGQRDYLILDPDEFYILASKEAVRVPPDHAAEMMPFNPMVGEFRVHYAGFMDPGFGPLDRPEAGSRIVLEVRSHEVPFTLEDGQLVGRLHFERLTAKPERLYGADFNSHYQGQGLKLSKHFRCG